jgi:hypothetical protein
MGQSLRELRRAGAVDVARRSEIVRGMGKAGKAEAADMTCHIHVFRIGRSDELG